MAKTYHLYSTYNGEPLSREVMKRRVMKALQVLKENNSNLDNKAIGESLGCSAGKIQRYSTGVTIPGTDWINSFCKAYGIRIDWMYGEEDSDDGRQESIFNRRGKVISEQLKDRNSELHKGGERIHELRDSLGMSLREFGHECGVSSTNIFKIENGQIVVSKGVAEKIEDTFHIGTGWILYGDETQKSDPITKEVLEWLKEKPDIRKKLWKEYNREHRNT